MLAELPRRLPDDLASFFDDLRESAEEGARREPSRQREWIDDDLAEADDAD